MAPGFRIVNTTKTQNPSKTKKPPNKCKSGSFAQVFTKDAEPMNKTWEMEEREKEATELLQPSLEPFRANGGSNILCSWLYSVFKVLCHFVRKLEKGDFLNDSMGKYISFYLGKMVVFIFISKYTVLDDHQFAYMLFHPHEESNNGKNKKVNSHARCHVDLKSGFSALTPHLFMSLWVFPQVKHAEVNLNYMSKSRIPYEIGIM